MKSGCEILEQERELISIVLRLFAGCQSICRGLNRADKRLSLRDEVLLLWLLAGMAECLHGMCYNHESTQEDSDGAPPCILITFMIKNAKMLHQPHCRG